MKTTLLKEVMETYIDWHQEINLPLMQYFNNEEGLSVLLARAGYYFPNLTTLGNLSALIELDRLKPVICALLVIENKTPLLRMAISLALLLKMQEAIPILITVFKEDRYNLEDDLIDLVRLLKALTISTIPEQDLLELHEQASIKHPENESLKLLHIGQLMRHDKTYKQGWAIIQTLTNDQAKRRCLIFLATIHKKGIDTSGWLDFIVSDTEDEGYYLPFKLQWIKTLGSREVIEPFLDLEQDNRVFSLLCTALEAPDEWQMLLPLLFERKQPWLDDGKCENINIIIAMLALLGRFGIDTSKYIGHDSFAFRCGAWLGMIDYKSKRNWTKLIEDEDDNDVKFTMEFVDIMNRKEASNLKESVFLQDYKQRNYGLQPIVRAIIADKNPIDRLQPLVFDHRLTKLKNSRELTALSKQHAWFVFRYLFKSDSYDDCMEAFFVKQKDSMDLYSFNSIMLAMLHSDDRVGFYLQEKFISELDFSKAETLLMIAHCRKIDLNSLLATSKAKFHHEFTEDISLSSAEFESLYPLLFIDGLSDSYKDPMLHASLPLIKADPTKALQLFRFLEMEDDLKESLIKSMQENLDESLSIALAATRTELSQNMIADLFHLYNYNNNLVNPFLASLHESTLKNEEIVIFLMEAFENVDNEEQRQYIFEQIAVRNTVEDLTSYIEGSLENASWTIRRVFIRYIGSHPSISFRKIWQRLLKDEDRDVRAAAGQAGPALLKIIYPDKNIYCFTRTENDEDEMLKENMELIRSEVQQPDLYKDYLSVKFVMQEINVSTDKKKSALPPGPGLTNKEIQDLLLHLAVDFVEESTERVVLRVQETESSEVLNWLLEKGSYTFCTVDKV